MQLVVNKKRGKNMKLMSILEELSGITYFNSVDDAINSVSNSAYKRCIFFDKNIKKYFLVRYVDKQKYISDKSLIYVPSKLEY